MQNKYFFFQTKFFISRSPQVESVHVVLGLYPRVHVPCARAHQVTSKVLAIHIVEELGHGRHVEDVEV